MPKFKEGDVVVPIKVKFHMNTETHRNYCYTQEMHILMMKGKPLKVRFSKETMVNAGNYNWHPDDLEFFNLSLENK